MGKGNNVFLRALSHMAFHLFSLDQGTKRCTNAFMFYFAFALTNQVCINTSLLKCFFENSFFGKEVKSKNVQ